MAPFSGGRPSPQQRQGHARYRFVVALSEEVPEALEALCDNVYPPFVALCETLGIGGDDLSVDDMLYKLQRAVAQPPTGAPSPEQEDWINSPETQARVAAGELKVCGPEDLRAMGLIDDPRYVPLRLALNTWLDNWHLRPSWFLSHAIFLFGLSLRFGPPPTPSLIVERWSQGRGGVITSWLNPTITLKWRQDLEEWPDFEQRALAELRQMRDQSLAEAGKNGYIKVGVKDLKFFCALARHIALSETYEVLAEKLMYSDSRNLRREVSELRKLVQI